jgi:FKBP-type peptidyl-prolyl cis-trans isomerase
MSINVSDGVQKDILQQGSGATPRVGQMITVHCIGSQESGKFWSTHDPGQKPFSFKVGLGQVIEGTYNLAGVGKMGAGALGVLLCICFLL